MNISKAERLIVKDKDGNQLCNIKIGMISLNTLMDKTKEVVIQQAK